MIINKNNIYVSTQFNLSAANLGTGFDSIGICANKSVELSVYKSDCFHIYTDLNIPLDKTNIVCKVFEGEGLNVDEFAFVIKSDIPAVGGVGMSAAMILCAVEAAKYMLDVKKAVTVFPGRLTNSNMESKALKYEKHADNIMASLHGGVQLVQGNKHHTVTYSSINTTQNFVWMLPKFDCNKYNTETSRLMLPQNVLLSDASHNIAGAMALMHYLLDDGAFNNAPSMREFLDDKLHQPQRRLLFKESFKVIDIINDQYCQHTYACLSGSGPTILLMIWKKDHVTLNERIKCYEDQFGDMWDFVALN